MQSPVLKDILSVSYLILPAAVWGSLFYTQEKCSRESVINLPKVTQLVNDGSSSQTILIQGPVL